VTGNIIISCSEWVIVTKPVILTINPYDYLSGTGQKVLQINDFTTDDS